MRPAAPALGSGHLFSHQTRSTAGKQDDSRHPNSGKTRSLSSQMATCAPGQNEAHTKALTGSVPRVPPAFGATWHSWQSSSPAEASSERRLVSSGKQIATQKQHLVWSESNAPSTSCPEGPGRAHVRAGKPRGWKQSSAQIDAPAYIKKYYLPA